MALNDQGLGSDNMSQADKDKIHSLGGKASVGASRTGGTNRKTTISNKSGGGALKPADQRKGGESSHQS
jgi:hypothetical protein